MVFSFDGCIANTRAALVAAATELAALKGAPQLLPHQQQALAIRSTSTERFFIDVMGWTRDMKQANELSYEVCVIGNGLICEFPLHQRPHCHHT